MNTRSSWNDDASDLVAYEAMLRVVSGSVPEHTISWDTFHTRLNARAELSLARLRHPRRIVVTLLPTAADLISLGGEGAHQ